MSYILNIETATTNCSVSLSYQGETLCLVEDYNSSYSHAERLHVYIDQVLKKADIISDHLEAIAVSKGPGSYTGLRIGVSAAKGLSYALNIPLISVSTLEALAYQVEAKDGLIVPLLDARRMEVYAAVFDAEKDLVRATKAEVIDRTSFNTYLEHSKVYFIGTGVSKTKDVIQSSNAIFIEDKLPTAAAMSKLSFEKFKKNDIEDVAYFEPYYLKDFIVLKPSS